MSLTDIGSICSILGLLFAVIIYFLQKKISKDIIAINTQIGNNLNINQDNSTRGGIIGNSNAGNISNNTL